MWGLIFILLAGCTPVKPEFIRNQVTTVFVPMTKAELVKKCKGNANGCVEPGAVCMIYAQEPKYVGDNAMDILGEEFYHCLRGRFHGM
jgi:hypothetical protein